jgi:hypothetical protein
MKANAGIFKGAEALLMAARLLRLP